AMALSFGRPVTPHFMLEKCDVVVSLGYDLLGPGPQQVSRAGAWTRHRGEVAPGSGRSRLHIVESMPSLTGTVASTRLAGDPDRIEVLARAIAAEFKIDGFAQPELEAAERKWLDQALRELRKRGGHSLLAIGQQFGPDVQMIAALVNERLNNANTT